MKKFFVEQLALCPADPAAAIELLTAMGAGEFACDHVSASGMVRGEAASNEADLAFDYVMLQHARELEVLHYTKGANWMAKYPPSASHIGMHIEEDDFAYWREFFHARGIGVAQEVYTHNHTNPVIAGKRLYHYVIFDTRSILGVDVKFIIRKQHPAAQ